MTHPSSHDHDVSERRKATLYCWGCDHASPIEGDWVLEPRGESLARICPNCGTVIADRPRDETETQPRPTTAWSRVVWTSVSAWRASLDAGLAGLVAVTRYQRSNR